jgi:hypothetical protein
LSSAIAIASAAFVGARLTSYRSLPVCFVLGAMLQSAVMTVLALSHLAYPWLVAPVVLVPLLRPVRFTMPDKRIFAVLTPFLFYAFLMTGVNPIGGDLANYHMVIPRAVLWDHAFIFNPFSHEAGLSYGWHMFGVGSFLFGAERGYVLLSFWVFLLTCLLVFEVFAERYGKRIGLAAAFVCGFVICGLSRDSIANDDGSLLLAEMVALYMLFTTRYAWGWVVGFALSIKFTAFGAPVALAAIRFAQERSIRTICIAALISLPMAAIWPLVNFFNTGSPLPQMMRPVLPQLSETMAFLTRAYGLWYSMNWSDQFTGGMVGLGLLLLAIPFGLLSREFLQDRLVRVLAAYAVLRFIVVVFIVRRADVLWHDRYHLSTYLALSLVSLIAAKTFLREMSPTGVAWLAGSLTAVQLFTSTIQAIPAGPHNERVEFQTVPSMLQRMRSQLETFREVPGGSRMGEGFGWISQHLPQDALIATTVVDPYYLRRRYIELLPLSQQEIDLSASPETILAELRRRGVTHLHLAQYSGFNVWMNEIIQKWLANLNRIPELPGVRKLASLLNHAGKGREDIYRIAGSEPEFPVTPFDPKAFIENGALVVLWTPTAGTVDIYQGDTMLGEVGGQFGDFRTHENVSPGMRLHVSRDDGQSTDLVPGIQSGQLRFCGLDQRPAECVSAWLQ